MEVLGLMNRGEIIDKSIDWMSGMVLFLKEDVRWTRILVECEV